MVKSTLIYALTALSVCGRASESGGRDALRKTDVYGENPFSKEAHAER